MEAVEGQPAPTARAGLGLDGDFFEYNDPPVSRNEIVATSSLVMLRTRISMDFEERSRGRIRLVFGKRGSGKSTCLAYVMSLITSDFKGSRYLEFNAGRYTSKMSTMGASEAVEFFLKSLAEAISDGKFSDINHVIDALAKARQKHFLLIDNLDRLYAPGADLELVQRLFQQADAVLKELAKHLVIVITAAPEWAPVVKANDLSYLNYDGRVVLEGMTFDELRRAVEARLASRNLRREDYFTDTFLNALVIASSGTPRTIFQMLEAYNGGPDAPPTPLKVEQMLPPHLEMVKTGALSALQAVAQINGKHSGGVAKLVSYCDMAKVHKADLTPALRQLEDAYKEPLKHDVVRLRQPWGIVAELGGRQKWHLREPVRLVLAAWTSRTYLDLPLLLTFLPAATGINFGIVGIQDFDEKYRRTLTGEALRRYEKAHEAYSTLVIGDETMSIARSIALAWDAVEGLALAIHKVSGLTPQVDSLSHRLAASPTFGKAAAELLDGVNKAYVQCGRGFNASSEDMRTIANYKQSLFEDPARVNLYRHEQMEDLRRAAIRVHETLMRQLTPAKLHEVRTRHLPQIQGLIAEGEGQMVEFKPAFRNDPKDPFRPNLEMERRVMEGICAMANSDGGTVALGISNTNQILGMEMEIAKSKPSNFDGFELQFRQRLDKMLPGISYRVNLRQLNAEGHALVLVEIADQTGDYVDLIDFDDSGRETGRRFLVRTGNRNKELTGQDKVTYQQR